MNRLSDHRLLLYRGTSFVGTLIKWQTRSVYSHASMICSDGFTYESWTSKGVVKHIDTATDHKDGTVVDVFRFESTEAQDALILTFLNSHIGDKYDFLSVLRFISRRPEASWSKDRWFCSEYVFTALKEAGIPPLVRVETYEVSPGMLSVSPKLLYERSITL